MKIHSDNKLLVIMESLPVYCMGYFSSILHLNINTRIAYAGDLKLFFDYLCSKNNCKTHDITIDMLAALTADDMQLFFEYMENYENEGRKQKNSEYGMKRKLTAIKSFFRYLLSVGKIKYNPAEFVNLGKYITHNEDDATLVLKDNEQESIVNEVLNEENKSARSQIYHDKIKYRDKTIIMLFLYTGINVSELVGLDMSDVDIDKHRIEITDNKEKNKIFPINEEIYYALTLYLSNERNELLSYVKNEDVISGYPQGPLFVSLRHKRMSVRQIENIVKKYSANVLPDNVRVNPNTLRKTYFNNIYTENKEVLQTLGYRKNYSYLSDKK